MVNGISAGNMKPRSHCWSHQRNQSRGNDITHTHNRKDKTHTSHRIARGKKKKAVTKTDPHRLSTCINQQLKTKIILLELWCFMMKRTFNLMQMWAETEKFDSDFFIKKKIYSRVVWLSSCRNPDEIFSDLIKMSSVTFKLYISEFWVEIKNKKYDMQIDWWWLMHYSSIIFF